MALAELDRWCLARRAMETGLQVCVRSWDTRVGTTAHGPEDFVQMMSVRCRVGVDVGVGDRDPMTEVRQASQTR